MCQNTENKNADINRIKENKERKSSVIYWFLSILTGAIVLLFTLVFFGLYVKTDYENILLIAVFAVLFISLFITTTVILIKYLQGQENKKENNEEVAEILLKAYKEIFEKTKK